MDERPVMVSIKCLVYNHEPYLRQCLDGFVAQQANFRFEAIVHDDASTDASPAIIREYAEKYPDIIKPIYQAENQHSKHDGSIGRAINPLLTGKYVAWCEGDDFWIDPHKLQRQVDFMESHPDYLLNGTNALVLWENGVAAPSYFNRSFESHTLSASEVIGKWPLPTAGLLLRRELFDLRKEFKTKIYSGDMALILVAFAKGKIWYDANISAVYRKDQTNTHSVSNNAKLWYVVKQHIVLYTGFNDFTNKAYDALISKHLRYLSYQDRFQKRRSRYGKIVYLFYPKKVLNKIAHKLQYLLYKRGI